MPTKLDRKYVDLKGQVFGRLTVLEYLGIRNDCANWKCGCRCGWYCEANIGDLRRTSRPKRSCGKCKIDHRFPAEWLAWRNAQVRCYNQDSPDYHNWGGRGITMCKRWRDDCLNFIEDMGLKESVGLSLDRIDNNGNYEPGNCRWTDRDTQANNKRNTRGSHL